MSKRNHEVIDSDSEDSEDDFSGLPSEAVSTYDHEANEEVLFQDEDEMGEEEEDDEMPPPQSQMFPNRGAVQPEPPQQPPQQQGMDYALTNHQLENPPGTPVLDRIAASLQQLDEEIVLEDMEEAAAELYARWVTYPLKSVGYLIDVAYKLYNLERTMHTVVSVNVLETTHEKLSFPVLRLFRRFLSDEYITSEDSGGSLVTNRFMRILEMVFNTKSMIQMDQSSRQCMNPSMQVDGEVDIEKWAFKFVDKTDNTPYQSLLLHMLDCAYQSNYRKYGSYLYTQIMSKTEDGQTHRTHAWQEAMKFTDFIYSNVRKETRFEHWKNFTSQRDLVSPLANYLQNCQDPELQALVPDRHVFSFKQGVYNAYDNHFYHYGSQNDPIPTDTVAAKFFELDFPAECLEESHHWRAIKTPNLDKVLDSQKIPNTVCEFRSTPSTPEEEEKFAQDRAKFPDEPREWSFIPHPEDESVERRNAREATLFTVRDWFYVFMGRMIYNIGELDQWQTIMFLKGVAGSGKSTLGRVLAWLYDPADVGVLSNNLEKKFGLSSIADKKIYLCYELKNDFGVDQGEFQSMISGEQMSIPRKFETATSIEWSAPGFLMGNEVANWVDNSGSISRRVIIGDFKERVTDGDPLLFSKLQDEMAHIILKINIAYQTAAAIHGKKDIWKALPQYFQDQKRQLRASTHALAAFFEYGDCTKGPEERWLYTEFRSAVQDYMHSNGFSVKWGADFYRAVFEEYGVRDEEVTEGDIKRRYVTGVGPRLVNFQIDE